MTPSNRIAFALSLAALLAACSGADPASSTKTLGSAGGAVSTSSGITLRVPPGALSAPTAISIVEAEPGSGKVARVRLEPSGLALGAPATVSFQVADANVRVSEVEHGAEGEVRHELEKRRGQGEVEIEVEHLAELEVEHGLACDLGCGAGFECDDGVCKVHVEDDPATHDVGDDHGVDDPATHDVGDDDGGTTPGHP